MTRGAAGAAPRDPWFHPFAPYLVPLALALAARVDAWRGLPYAAEDAYITFRYAENAAKGLPPATLEGKNDWKRTGYGGPCPPIGRHRYFHKLYALDTVLPDLRQPTKAKLEKAMKGHVLASAELVGTYEMSR